MKARFFALAALVLGLASCQQEFNGVTPVGGEVDFQLKVDARELGTTRAGDDAENPQNAFNSAFGAIDYFQATDWSQLDLRYSLEVYDVAEDYTDATPIKDRLVKIVDAYEPVAFDLRLVPNRDYHFVVFADFVPEGASDDAAIEVQRELGLRHSIGENLGQISIKYDAIIDELTDAYFATKDIKISNSAAQDIELKRPYGKVRVIATDLHELNTNVEPGSVKVVYDAFHPMAFNAVNGKIDGEYETKEYSYTYAELFKNVAEGGLSAHYYTAGYDANVEANIDVNANGVQRHKYMTLFTDYILANEQQESIHFTMEVIDADKQTIKITEFNTDIPVQRNHLTTIIGNVLTTATEINVTIDDNFEGYYQYNLWDGKSVQAVVEKDGVYEIYEAAELAWFAQEVNNGNTFLGKTVKLCKDIHLNGERWTPIGNSSSHQGTFRGTFDGQGHGIEDLFVDNEQGAGLFGMVSPKAIRNVTIYNANINSTHFAGALAGWVQSVDSQSHNRGVIENCHVVDANVTLSVDNKDNGDKAGALIGYAVRVDITGCSVDNAKVTAYRDVAGFVGHAHSATVVSGNTVNNIDVIADQTVDYIEVKAANAGAIAGRVSSDATVKENTVGDEVSVVVKIDTNDERDAYVAKENERVHVTFEAGEYSFTQDLKVNGAIQANLGGKVTLNVNNNKITTGNNSDYGFIAKGEGNELVINDAEVVSMGGGIAAANGAKVVFNGNSLAVNTTNTSARYNVYTSNGGEVVINGGEFSFSKKDGKRAYVYANAGTRVVINGGTFGKASTRSDYKAGIMGAGEVIINAGTFGFDPTNWVSEESLVQKVGDVWVVTGARVIYSQDQLNAALTTEYVEGQTLYLVNGNYEGLTDMSNKKLTIKSTNGAAYFNGMVWADNSEIKFQDVHFTNPNGVQHPNSTNSQYYTTINNQYPLVGAYLNSNLEFENCTFHITGPTNYGIYGYAKNNLKFNDCKFECNGIRPIANNGDELTITNCTFDSAYHYAARIFENSGDRMTVVFQNNKMVGSNAKGEFEGINISKKGGTATVYADFTISGNTEALKYRYHKDVTLDASCTGAELFEQEQ